MSEQQQFPFFGVMPSTIVDLDPIVVAGCRHWAQALRLCIDKARVRRTDRQWARALNISPGTWNTLKNADHHEKEGRRTRHLNPDLIAPIQALAQNRAISQYLDMRAHGQLFCQRTLSPEEELERLKARVAELEKIAA